MFSGPHTIVPGSLRSSASSMVFTMAATRGTKASWTVATTSGSKAAPAPARRSALCSNRLPGNRWYRAAASSFCRPTGRGELQPDPRTDQRLSQFCRRCRAHAVEDQQQHAPAVVEDRADNLLKDVLDPQ